MQGRLSNRNHGLRLGRLFLVFVLAIATLAGCAATTTDKYRQARQLFNQAAQEENGFKLEQAKSCDYGLVRQGNTTLSPLLLGLNHNRMQSENGYENALALLQSIDESETQLLEQDGMLGDKLTLEALCLWRLGRYSEIETLLVDARLAAERQARREDTARTRDSFILQALPGLIINDQAHAMIMAASGSGQAADVSRFEAIKRRLVGPDEHALKYIRAARIAAAKQQHPVVPYLLQAELAVYRNLMVAYDRYRIRPNPWVLGEAPEYTASLALLGCLQQLDTPEGTVFGAWHQLFGAPTLPADKTCDLTR